MSATLLMCLLLQAPSQPGFASQQSVTVEIATDSPRVLLGEPFHLILTITNAGDRIVRGRFLP